jgi:hypothetical protein
MRNQVIHRHCMYHQAMIGACPAFVTNEAVHLHMNTADSHVCSTKSLVGCQVRDESGRVLPAGGGGGQSKMGKSIARVRHDIGRVYVDFPDNDAPRRP